MDRDGNVTEFLEPFTAEDRRMVDEDANSYLADAGVDSRASAQNVGSRLDCGGNTGCEYGTAATGCGWRET